METVGPSLLNVLITHDLPSLTSTYPEGTDLEWQNTTMYEKDCHSKVTPTIGHFGIKIILRKKVVKKSKTKLAYES